MIAFLFAGCVGVPKGVQPVQRFALERYLGRWYEIARLDHSFERGLSHVTADYSMRKDRGVRVLNRGYSEKEEEWKSAEGKAYFVKGPDEGYLKVSFFGPFYGSLEGCEPALLISICQSSALLRELFDHRNQCLIGLSVFLVKARDLVA